MRATSRLCGLILFCLLLSWNILPGGAARAATAQLWQVTVAPSGAAYAQAAPYAGDKTPLVVIHGLSDTIHSAPIKALTDALAKESSLPAYQVFTLEYDSTVSIDDNGKALDAELAQVIGDRPFVMIGYSVGGLVARAGLELHATDIAGHDFMARCLRLITLGTPHHGTPLANPQWLQIAEGKDFLLPVLIQAAQQYANLPLGAPGVLDLAWDDFDGGTPASARSGESAFLARLNAAFAGLSAATSQKYLFYGGYASPLYVTYGPITQAPFDQETQYRTLGGIMARLLPEGTRNDTYAANDGLVPLNSTLFLIPAAPGSPNEPVGAAVNEDQTKSQGLLNVAIRPDAIDARKPAVRAVQAFSGNLHYYYPQNPEVYARIVADLQGAVAPVCSDDLNGDGRVNVIDAQVALVLAIGLRAPTPQELQAADCDGSGAITIAEATRILMRAVGLQ